MKNSLFTGLIESGFISCRSGTSVFQMFILDTRGQQHVLGCTSATGASVVTEWDSGSLALQPSRHIQNLTHSSLIGYCYRHDVSTFEFQTRCFQSLLKSAASLQACVREPDSRFYGCSHS